MLFGTAEALRKYVPFHEVKIQRFESDELSPVSHEDYRLPLVAMAERIYETIKPNNSIQSFEIGLYRVDVPKFPDRAVREAIPNALLHRDYARPGNIAIRIYMNRLEIANPGTWFGGVNERNILVSESHRRNETLASAFQKIGLAERSALGVKRMFTAMLTNGKMPPEYRSNAESVTVILKNGTIDTQFVALINHTIRNGVNLGVFDLLILAHVRRHREISVAEAASLCQQNETSARKYLDDLRNAQLLDWDGSGSTKRYVLGPLAYEKLLLKAERPRDLGITMLTFEAMLMSELEREKARGVTSREIQAWSQYDPLKAKRALERFRKAGKIVWSGKRGMGSRYWLHRYAPKK
jgi:ATP-dependent DNA helicase RecG